MLRPPPTPICMGCRKRPRELPEFADPRFNPNMTPDVFCRANEATYNRANGHFMCTNCYIEAGQPKSERWPHVWICP